MFGMTEESGDQRRHKRQIDGCSTRARPTAPAEIGEKYAKQIHLDPLAASGTRR